MAGEEGNVFTPRPILVESESGSPQNVTDVVELYGGYYEGCGVHSDRSMTCWGNVWDETQVWHYSMSFADYDGSSPRKQVKLVGKSKTAAELAPYHLDSKWLKKNNNIQFQFG